MHGAIIYLNRNMKYTFNFIFKYAKNTICATISLIVKHKAIANKYIYTVESTTKLNITNSTICIINMQIEEIRFHEFFLIMVKSPLVHCEENKSN